jgi:hypothetical protein
MVTLALMDLERAVRLDNWANLQTLATLKRGNAPSQAVEIVAHIVAVSQLWLARGHRHTAAFIHVAAIDTSRN